MKKTAFSILILYIFGLVMVGGVSAKMPDQENVKTVYPDATVKCNLCHPAGNFKELNLYGKDYKDAGMNEDAVKAIIDKDSDADGVTNDAELKAGTNPGDAESK